MKTKALKLNHSLQVLQCENEIVHTILAEIKTKLAGMDIEVLRNNSQLIIDICTCIENVEIKKKINKKAIALKIMTELFKDINIDAVDNVIETAIENGIIKKHTMLTKCLKLVSRAFLVK
jgi:hypothetical protein